MQAGAPGQVDTLGGLMSQQGGGGLVASLEGNSGFVGTA